MRYLLDTNVLLWYITGNKNLSKILYETIAYSNSVYTSIISLQEIAIKNRDGKLILKIPFNRFIEKLEQEANIKILNLDNSHIITLNQLTIPSTHKDPFDHLIISQAITEQMCLLSSDGHFHLYEKQGLYFVENL